jgi:hypothetical protein
VGNNNIHPQLTNMLVQQVTTDQATSTQGPVGTSHALQLLIDDLGLSTCSTPPAKHHVPAPRRAAEVSCHASQGQDQHFDEHKELERAFASLMQKCRNLPAEYIRTKILPLLQRMNKMASAELRRMRRAQRQCEWHCSRHIQLVRVVNAAGQIVKRRFVRVQQLGRHTRNCKGGTGGNSMVGRPAVEA